MCRAVGARRVDAGPTLPDMAAAWPAHPSWIISFMDDPQDSRFQQNEFVAAPPHVRFYCGAPLASGGGRGRGVPAAASSEHPGQPAVLSLGLLTHPPVPNHRRPSRSPVRATSWAAWRCWTSSREPWQQVGGWCARAGSRLGRQAVHRQAGGPWGGGWLCKRCSWPKRRRRVCMSDAITPLTACLLARRCRQRPLTCCAPSPSLS